MGIFTKFMPKTPAIKERGRKMVETMVSAFITSFKRKLVEFR